jgi:nucleotide-binding universal stress UspA family protein
MFEKILVCLDGSPFADRIIAGITAEALQFKSDLILFRAVSMPETIIPVAGPGAPIIPAITGGSIKRMMKEEQEAINYLEKISQSLIAQGLSVEIVVVPGSAGEAIVRYAEGNGCTLIVMASHGHGGFRRLTLGSTAEHVMRHAQIPSLIIR